MAQALRILGIDPGMRNIGVALMLYSPGVAAELLDLRLITTKDEKKKRGLRQKADDLRCLEHIRDEMRVISRTWGYDVVAFEECPSGGLGKIAIRKVALSWGTCWSLLTAKPGILSFDYMPVDLKRCVTGSPRASKVEMVTALEQRYPGLQDLDVLQSKKEHPADAMAAALLAMQDPGVIRLAQSLDKLLT